MTDKQTPPDWVLIEAAKRSKWTVLDIPTLRAYHGEYSAPYRALCDMIERYEQPPVDRKLLCAREAVARSYEKHHPQVAEDVRCGGKPGWTDAIVDALVAFELFEGGFGK